MTVDPRFQLPKLRLYLGLIEQKVVRACAGAEVIELLEPAEPRFDAPPDDGDWQPIDIGADWGGRQQWAYFRATLTVPNTWRGPIELRFDHQIGYRSAAVDDNYPAGPEGQVFIDGRRVGAVDRQHSRIRFAFKAGRTYDVRAVFFAARCECRHQLAELSLACVDAATEKLHHDLRVALDVIDQLDEDDLTRLKLIEAVEAAVRAIDVTEVLANASVTPELQRDPYGTIFYASVAEAQNEFDIAIAEMAPDGEAPDVLCLGHAHIDLGWLWPIGQTHHKCVRTFATQCRLLDQYEQWVFQQSSPQAYAWVEQDAPELFERMLEQIAADRWEPEGASWVEMDTNLPGGESLVRQLLYGKRYFREKLGVDSRVLWLPDVFGYSAALPQLLKLAEVDGFVTSKISWSQYNRLPHDTFRWRGIDGSEIPTHFITTPHSGGPNPESPIATYNAMMTPAELSNIWTTYRQKREMLTPLLTYGWGDGGGGPTELMLETVKRLADPAMPTGLPRPRFGKVSDLIENIAERADELPVWDGELYLEYHRATYTTQAWLKRANRTNEIRLHNLEWLATLAADDGHELDKNALDAMWQDLLLIQFHDILPGSSVNEVYETEVRPMMQRLADQADAMIDEAAGRLTKQIDTSAPTKPLVAFNTLSWDRSDPIQLPDGTWRDDVTIPAGGWTVIDAAVPAADATAELTVSNDGRAMVNRWWALRLDEQGRIIELFDRAADRQVLPEGAAANEWHVFEDRPLAHEAWDIDLYYQDYPLPAPALSSIRVVEQGPARAAVELTWQMPQVGSGPRSIITQTLAMYANCPRIDFETRANWHDHHKTLKVAFPVDVRTTEATFEIQFGHLQRPTHRNTSWDVGRFEVCAHRFVDLSEHGYGASLINDCKYGYDVLDGVMRMTCIRRPTAPDAHADEGEHVFNYALLPHAGTFQQAGTVQAAAEFNNRPIVRDADRSAGSLPAEFAFVRCDNDAVVIDTMKPAEDGRGVILRLYESHGSHAPAALTFAHAPGSVQCVDLLEEPTDAHCHLLHQSERVGLCLRPFQVVSLRLTP